MTVIAPSVTSTAAWVGSSGGDAGQQLVGEVGGLIPDLGRVLDGSGGGLLNP